MKNNNDAIIKNLRSNEPKIIGLTPKYWAPLSVILMNSCLIFAFYLGKDPTFCKGCANASRFGTALMWSLLTPLAFGAFIAFDVKYFSNFNKIYFN